MMESSVVLAAAARQTAMLVVVGVESKTTSNLTLDIDYIKIMANRDWVV